MKMTNEEKSLLASFKKIEGSKNRADVLFHVETVVRAQEALKADYGLVGPDAPLFNGAGTVPGPAA